MIKLRALTLHSILKLPEECFECQSLLVLLMQEAILNHCSHTVRVLKSLDLSSLLYLIPAHPVRSRGSAAMREICVTPIDVVVTSCGFAFDRLPLFPLLANVFIQIALPIP